MRTFLRGCIRAELVILACVIYLAYWQFRKGGLLETPVVEHASYEDEVHGHVVYNQGYYYDGNYRIWTRINDRNATFGSYGSGTQVYGSDSAILDNARFENNVMVEDER